MATAAFPYVPEARSVTISNLKRQTFAGSLWLGGAQVGLRLITIVSGIILARLLNPEDFGMIYLAQIVLSTASLVTALGMGAAVIHSQENPRDLAYHGLTITAVSGFLIFLLLQLTAPLFADLLGSRELVPLLRVMLFMLLLSAASTVPEALLYKQLTFGSVSKALVAVELLYLGLAIGLAVAGFGMWSLVYASLARGVLYALLLWISLPHGMLQRERRWDWLLARRLLRFGARTTGGGLTTFLYQTLDNIAVGKLLGAAAIGFYGRAMDFTSRTVDGFSTVIGIVLFPSFSTIQDDRERLARGYFTSVRATSFVTIPLSMGIFITAAELVEVLLGQKWRPMIPALQILSFVSLVKPLSACSAALFSAVGRPEYNMRAGLVVLAGMLVLIPVLLTWGFPGVALAVLGAHILGLAFNVYQIHLVFPGKVRHFFTSVVPACAASVAMVVAVQLARSPISLLSGGRFSIPTLLLLILIGGLVYAGLLFWMQKPLVMEIVHLVCRRGTPAEGGSYH